MRRLAASFGTAAALLFVASETLAADPIPSLDLRGFHAPTDPTSGVYVQPADAPRTGEWNVGLWTSYAYRPITLRDAKSGAVLLDVVKHQLTSDLVAGVGLWNRVHVGFDLPVALVQTGDRATGANARVLGDAKLPGQAFGDLGLDVKLTIVRPTRGDAGGFALALHERLSVPTGDPTSYLGEGAVTDEARALFEYRLAAIGVHAALGFKLRGHDESLCDPASQAACAARFGNEIPFGLGVSLVPRAIGLDEKGRTTWFLEMNGHLPASPIAPFKSKAASSAQLDAAARIAIGGDVSVLAGLQTALLGGAGDARVRALIQISWAPKNHDKDGDKIPDDVDQCPDLAEDFDGFEDHDGCPEADNDGDGIPDSVDRCPNTKEDLDGYQDADGCPDPDNDQDRIPDVDDACPGVAGAPDPDPTKNGCPPTDQ